MAFEFYDAGLLVDGDLTLLLDQTLVDISGSETLPTYKFRMVGSTDEAEMGFINLRIGTGENLTRYRGHIGFGVNPRFRGRRYAARSCVLLLPLARRARARSVVDYVQPRQHRLTQDLRTTWRADG